MDLQRIGRQFGVAAIAACAAAASLSVAAPRFETVGRDAIPRQVVKTLAQDSRGFLWVATGDGLVRFDGYRFQPVERDHADPARRNLGWVRAMAAGRDGRVWISSEADGLVSYDPATDRIHDHAERSGNTPNVMALAEDRDGAIWSGTFGGGLERHAAPHGASRGNVTRFVHQPGAPGSLPDDRIEALRVDAAGTLWVGSWQGLSRRQADATTFEAMPATAPGGARAATLSGRRVLTLLAASDKRLWVGTQQGDLVIIDPASGAARWLAPPTGGRGATTALAQSDDGRVWVGTERGLEVWDAAGTARLEHLQHDSRRRDGLAANQVTTLLKDRAGAIWVGGLGIGLQRHDPGSVGIQVQRGLPDAGFDGNVHGLLALADGQIWAATSSVPLVALDAGLRPQGAITLPRGDAKSAPITRVQAMAQGTDGAVWLAAGGWLLKMDARRRVQSMRRHGAGEVVRLHAGVDGSVWLVTLDGLFRLPPNAATSTSPLRLALAGGARFGGMVQAIAAAPDGALWVGAASGLYRLAPGRHDGLEPVSSPPGQGLGNPVVGGLLFGRDGTLWVDTAVTGLHRATVVDGARASFDRVSVRHGIHNRPFGVNLLEDRRGRIWTQQYMLDPAADRVIALTAADGKDFGMGWFFSYTATPDGRFLFGGTDGVMVVEPERFEASNDMPPLAVTALRVDGRRVSIAGLPAQLALGPEHHGLAIEFAALDFSDPQRIRYAYQLEGIDPDWVPTGADFRVASYGNLPPGDYTLRIRATNRSGAWMPEPLEIPVTVAPAWWQRLETRLLALAGLLSALLAYFRWRMRRLRQRQRELEAKVSERTLELRATTQQLEIKSAELEQASLTDPLSGLHNRRYLQQHIDDDVARALRRVKVAGVDDADLIFFLIDIDRFKLVNDELGHPAGDAVIRQIPGRLRAAFRGSDHIVRWGGEEFLIVVRDGSRGHAADLAERVRETIAAEPFVLDDGQPLRCTCSIGFACFPLDRQRPDALGWHDVVSVADAALLQAKQAGRNRWAGVVEADASQRPATPAGWLSAERTTMRRS